LSLGANVDRSDVESLGSRAALERTLHEAPPKLDAGAFAVAVGISRRSI